MRFISGTNWAELTSAGEAMYHDPEQRKINRLQNIIIITFIALHAVQLLATVALGSYLLVWDFGNFYWNLLWYGMPPVLAIIMDSYLLVRKVRNRWSTRWDFVLQVWYLAGIISVSLFMGGRAGFWMFLIPTLLNPFMIYQGSLRLRMGWFAMNAAGFVSVIILGLRLPPLLPLPGKITDLVFWPISSVLACAALVMGAVGWWRMSLTARFLALWKRWSMRGVALFDDANAKKYRIIQNQLLLIFLTSMSYMLLVVLYLFWSYRKLGESISQNYFWYYAMPSIAQVLVLVACIFFARFVRNILPASIGLISGALFISYIGISLQKESAFYLFNLALLPLPFIALSMKTGFERILTGLAVIFIATQINFTHYFLNNYPSLHPLPVSRDAALVSYLTIVGLTASLAIVFFYTTRQSVITECVLEMERKNLALERKKSDDLLLNILPAEVAHELKEQGHTRPILFHSATVFFTDFVGFTKIAEHLPPEELVGELDKCFSYFDGVCARYKLEKLKTIGDAYMAAGGVPKPNHTHAIDCCLAALEIQGFMRQMKDIKEKMGFPYWELRLGINSGNLVAGVVGEKKFAYDVWGDTVNTASRMESSGVPGMINISEATYQQVRFLFVCEARGKIKAKNKGEIHMYFLHRIRPKYAADAEGRVPNEDFLALYDRIAGGARLVPRGSRQNQDAIESAALL